MQAQAQRTKPVMSRYEGSLNEPKSKVERTSDLFYLIYKSQKAKIKNLSFPPLSHLFLVFDCELIVFLILLMDIAVLMMCFFDTSKDCPNGKDNFRSQQCATFNFIPYEGKTYRWQAVHSKRNPCSLLCTPSDHSFIAKLQNKVVDGTKCRPRGSDMCVNGTCMVRKLFLVVYWVGPSLPKFLLIPQNQLFCSGN